MSPQFWCFLRVDLLVLFRARVHLWGLGSALVLGIAIRFLALNGLGRVSIESALGLLVGISAIGFGGVLIWREAKQGSLGALSTTPAEPQAFLASKISSLCGLGMVQGMVVLVSSGCPGPHDRLLFTLGILGMAAFGGLFGMVLTTYSWPRRVAVAAGLLALLPLLASVSPPVHGWTREWMPVPPFASLALIKGSLLSITTSALVLAFGSSCLSIAGLFVLCQRRLERLSRQGSAI